jgi:uncharacterized membrane protein
MLSVGLQFIWIFLGIVLFFIFVKFLYSQYNFTKKNYPNLPRKNPNHWGWQLVALFSNKDT